MVQFFTGRRVSEEQRSVVDAIGGGYDVVCQSKAGCGKSFTAFACVASLAPSKKSLALMFSKLLKEEARAKAESFGISTLEIHSFHSVLNFPELGVHVTDTRELEHYVQNYTPQTAHRDFSDVSFLIIDEAQDLSATVFEAIQIVRTWLHPEHQILILGDFFQCIYQSLTGSDQRYLMFPDRYFGRTFVRLRLSLSYRITKQMATFINEILMDFRKFEQHYPAVWAEVGPVILEAWGDGIRATKEGPEVQILKADLSKGVPVELVNEIYTWHTQQLLLITNSTKCGRVAKLVNSTSKSKWLVIDADSTYDENALRNKSCVSTIFSQKGREAHTVINTIFDHYIESYGDPCVALYHQYTIITRASHRCLCIQNESNSPFFPLRAVPITLTPPATRYTTQNLLDYVGVDRGIDRNLHVLENARYGALVLPSLVVRCRETFEDVTRFVITALKREIVRAFVTKQAPSTVRSQVYYTNQLKELISQNPLRHYGRQISNYSEWVDSTRFDAVVERGVVLLAHMVSKFGGGNTRLPSRVCTGKTFSCREPDLSGKVDIAFGSSVLVNIDMNTAPNIDDYHRLAATAGVVETADPSRTAPRIFIVSPLAGVVSEVRMATGRNPAPTFGKHLLLLLGNKRQRAAVVLPGRNGC